MHFPRMTERCGIWTIDIISAFTVNAAGILRWYILCVEVLGINAIAKSIEMIQDLKHGINSPWAAHPDMC